MTLLANLTACGAALALAIAAPASQTLNHLLDSPAAARAYDYGELRLSLSEAQFKSLSEHVEAIVRARLSVASSPCETEAEAFVRGGLASAAYVQDRYAWRSEQKAALAKLDALDLLTSKVLRGEDVNNLVYAGVIADVRTAQKAKDPRHRELFSRVAHDQAARNVFNEVWSMPQGPLRDLVARPLLARMCSIDAENVAWLKREWITSGWFTAARDGEQASQRAWLLVQHADQDPDFQRAVLPILARETGSQARANYAYLSDRVAVNAKEPQMFGTQGRCVGPGRWEPFAVRAQEALEARRAELGLPPEVEYQKMFANLCENTKE